MTTRIKILNEEKNGGHSVVVRKIHAHPTISPGKPDVINPGEEREYVLTDDVKLQVEENNGINNA